MNPISNKYPETFGASLVVVVIVLRTDKNKNKNKNDTYRRKRRWHHHWRAQCEIRYPRSGCIYGTTGAILYRSAIMYLIKKKKSIWNYKLVLQSRQWYVLDTYLPTINVGNVNFQAPGFFRISKIIVALFGNNWRLWLFDKFATDRLSRHMPRIHGWIIYFFKWSTHSIESEWSQRES